MDATSGHRAAGPAPSTAILLRASRIALGAGTILLLGAAGSELHESSVDEGIGVPVAKIAFVDFDRVVAESVSVGAVFKSLSAEMELDSLAIEDGRREIADMRSSLELQSALLAEDARASRWEELMKRADAVDRQSADYEWKLDGCRGQMETLTERINDAVGTVAEREGIAIVLRGEVVFYGGETADMTPLVVDFLDAQTSAPLGLSSTQEASPAAAAGDEVASRPPSIPSPE